MTGSGSDSDESAIACGGGEPDSTEADEIDPFEPGATNELRRRGEEQLKVWMRGRLVGFGWRVFSEEGEVEPDRSGGYKGGGSCVADDGEGDSGE